MLLDRFDRHAERLLKKRGSSSPEIVRANAVLHRTGKPSIVKIRRAVESLGSENFFKQVIRSRFYHARIYGQDYTCSFREVVKQIARLIQDKLQ